MQFGEIFFHLSWWNISRFYWILSHKNLIFFLPYTGSKIIKKFSINREKPPFWKMETSLILTSNCAIILENMLYYSFTHKILLSFVPLKLSHLAKELKNLRKLIAKLLVVLLIPIIAIGLGWKLLGMISHKKSLITIFGLKYTVCTLVETKSQTQNSHHQPHLCFLKPNDLYFHVGYVTKIKAIPPIT